MEYRQIGRHLAFDHEGQVPVHEEPNMAATQAAIGEYCTALDAVWCAATNPSTDTVTVAKELDEACIWLVETAMTLLGVCALREDGHVILGMAQEKAGALQFDLKTLDRRHWHPRGLKASLARVGADEINDAWAPLVLC